MIIKAWNVIVTISICLEVSNSSKYFIRLVVISLVYIESFIIISLKFKRHTNIIVNKKIVIEIKSKPFIVKEDEKQFWGYLKGSEYRLGFLVGFTPQKLVIKRYIYTKKLSA